MEPEVRRVLVADLGVDPARIVPDADLQVDLGLDSLALTEALLVLEDELVISIPDPVQARLQTFADLVAVVSAEVTGHGGTGRGSPGRCDGAPQEVLPVSP